MEPWIAGPLAGLFATAVMTILEVPAWRRRGFAGILDWEQNQTVAARLLGRPAEALLSGGLGLHFSHGVLAGFGVGLGLISADSPHGSEHSLRSGPERCDHSPISFRYAPASKRDFAWVGSAASRTTIQPSPYGSLLTISGLSARALFTSTTLPARGAKISLTAFTDSTVPIGSPCLQAFPIGGSSP